ncbi:DUF397 domain-containing protein [Actinomadura sp. ATCC 39365]
MNRFQFVEDHKALYGVKRLCIRDTEAPDQAPFVVRSEVWAAFIDGAKKGEFDF